MVYTKMCPKCKSLDVSEDTSGAQSMGMFPTRYICNSCGHNSYSFPEIEVSDTDSQTIDDPSEGAEGKDITSDIPVTNNGSDTAMSTVHTNKFVRILGILTIGTSILALVLLPNKWIGALALLVGIALIYYDYSK